jgi:hypothetical protein
MCRCCSLAVMLATAMLFGCASSTPDPRSATVSVVLPGVGTNAGKLARADLIERSGHTDIVSEVYGVPAWVTLPVHIYTYIYQGSCARLGLVAYSATDRVLTFANTAPSVLTVRSSIPANLRQLRSQPFALVLRSSPADADQLLFCAELPSS